MKYKIILFDVDDTLLEFGLSEKRALHNTFNQFGLESGLVDYEAKYKEISDVLWRDLEQDRITLTELGIERFKRLFHTNKLEIDAHAFGGVYLNYLGKETHLMPGAVKLCENLSSFRLAIITNGFTDVQNSRIKNSPFRDTFEHVIISEEVGFQKPHKGIFDHTFEKLQITNKSKVLIVGDSLTSDIQGGNKYGIDTCWFNPNLKTNTTTIAPTYEITHLMELMEIVKI
ncbi:YjjG family noncanonical pyrimidine nucleotidase [Sporosarcina sp. G11-34]|uniref:YjjG family noncanonical pyrimidine nucleotidase n=1 Tax=Sporosarcina sp. G11-34 TaxID=2849605 RepID=UPI0022A9454A|nr:YjjG family noncanonical pyrimidine nucleotidase [Sporosarcina sp. G11-34]MCZ2258179.1 YjjG family noncanonical pyrimidine nucleotidase [Sporosarcina sp. G11-34]